MLIPQECPEIGAGAGGGGRGVKALPMHRERSPCPGGIRGGLDHHEHSWGLRRGVSTADGGLVGMRRMPESGYGFVWQDAGGERVRLHQCPEFRWGKAEGSWLNAKVWNHEAGIVFAARSGEDTAVGQRGILTLDLDLNHNLDLVFNRNQDPGPVRMRSAGYVLLGVMAAGKMSASRLTDVLL